MAGLVALPAVPEHDDLMLADVPIIAKISLVGMLLIVVFNVPNGSGDIVQVSILLFTVAASKGGGHPPSIDVLAVGVRVQGAVTLKSILTYVICHTLIHSFSLQQT